MGGGGSKPAAQKKAPPPLACGDREGKQETCDNVENPPCDNAGHNADDPNRAQKQRRLSPRTRNRKSVYLSNHGTDPPDATELLEDALEWFKTQPISKYSGAEASLVRQLWDFVVRKDERKTACVQTDVVLVSRDMRKTSASLELSRSHSMSPVATQRGDSTVFCDAAASGTGTGTGTGTASGTQAPTETLVERFGSSDRITSSPVDSPPVRSFSDNEIVRVQRASVCSLHSVASDAEREVRQAMDAKRLPRSPSRSRLRGAASGANAKPGGARGMDSLLKVLRDVTQHSVADPRLGLPKVLAHMREHLDRVVTLWWLEAGLVCSSSEADFRPVPKPGEGGSEGGEQALALRVYEAEEADYGDDGQVGVPLPCGAGVLTANGDVAASTLSCFAEACSHVIRLHKLYNKAIFQQKKSTAMLGLADLLCQRPMEGNLQLEILDFARSLCGADRGALYLLRPNRKEVTAYFQTSDKNAQQLHIPLSADRLLSEVIATGEGVVLENAGQDPRYDSNTDMLTQYKTTSLLSFPIFYEGRVQAVAQVSNKVGGPFDTSDFEVLSSLVAFLGVALRNTFYYRAMLREKATTDMVLSIVKRVAESDIRSIESISESVIEGAKKLCNADRCALFLKDAERGVIVARMPSGGEIRIPLGSGIAGAVGKTGVHINITNAYQDPRFNCDVDKKTGYLTESILCYPIMNNGEVIAVAQLINKHDDIDRVCAFDDNDEGLLRSFAEFAGITIGNARLYRFVVEAGDDAMRLYKLHMQGTADVGSACEEARKKVRFASDEDVARISALAADSEGLDELDTFHFPIHKYNNKADNLIPFVVQIFKNLNFIKDFQIPMPKLYSFLGTLANMYRPIPYHNISHAFDVMHTLYIFMDSHDVRSRLTELDLFALIIIGLLHDVDHMGLNNSFHLKAETPLGILISASGSSSVLEVHHCTIAIEILQDPRSNILCNLSEEQVKQVYKVMTSAILGTDLTRHKQVCRDFDELEGKYDKECLEHRIKLMTMLTIVADVSNAYKPFSIARTWGAKITAEFNTQGEAERRQELPESFKEEPTVFAQQVQFCKSQVAFVQFLVVPLLDVLHKQLSTFKSSLDTIVCHAAFGVFFFVLYRFLPSAFQHRGMEPHVPSLDSSAYCGVSDGQGMFLFTRGKHRAAHGVCDPLPSQPAGTRVPLLLQVEVLRLRQTQSQRADSCPGPVAHHRCAEASVSGVAGQKSNTHSPIPPPLVGCVPHPPRLASQTGHEG